MNQRAPHNGAPDASDRDLSRARVAGRAAFAATLKRFFKRGLQQGDTYTTAWSHVLGVSEQKMRRWADEDHVRSAIAAGDLNALPIRDRVELLRFWLSEIEAQTAPVAPASDPRLFVISLTEIIGGLAKTIRKAVSDHRVTEIEWAAIAANLAEIEADARNARLAAEAAAKAAGRDGGDR